MSFSLPRKHTKLSQSLTHSPVIFFQNKQPANPLFVESQPRMAQPNNYFNYTSPVNNFFNINVNSNVTLSGALCAVTRSSGEFFF